jgi:hypothetical protein
MENQGDIANRRPARSALDRHAVTAAGQLLMSAIWLEHRVRRLSTLLSTPSSQRISTLSLVRPSAGLRSDRELLVPDRWSD